MREKWTYRSQVTSENYRRNVEQLVDAGLSAPGVRGRVMKVTLAMFNSSTSGTCQTIRVGRPWASSPTGYERGSFPR